MLGAYGASAAENRNWPLIPRWASTASPSMNGNQRYLPRRRGSAKVRPTSWAAKSSAPEEMAADGSRVQDRDAIDHSSGQAVGEPTADGFDLGQLGHDAMSVQGERIRRRRRR